MSVEKDKLVAIARRAAELVKRGWCQGHFHTVINGKDCYCVAGAVREAAEDIIPSSNPIVYHNPYLCSIQGLAFAKASISELNLGVWNDDPDRTHEEVIALMESVARLAEHWE